MRSQFSDASNSSAIDSTLGCVLIIEYPRRHSLVFPVSIQFVKVSCEARHGENVPLSSVELSSGQDEESTFTKMVVLVCQSLLALTNPAMK
jgi:hypothetical protein